MPIVITDKQVDNICHDYEFEVSNKELLAEFICKILTGQCAHITRALHGLDTVNLNKTQTFTKAIQQTITKLRKRNNGSDEDLYKVDGFLFQCISWIVLAIQYKEEKFYQKNPHQRLAMHGFDGLAVHLSKDNDIIKIIVTEDKCTEKDRNTIKSKVFPEFLTIEAGDNDFEIFQEISSLISCELTNEQMCNIQDNIIEPEYRQYRICITRQNIHNSDEGRKKLFKGFDSCITGSINRRTSSTISFNNAEREWMSDLNELVISKLEEKIK